jgi:hypothetical protein
MAIIIQDANLALRYMVVQYEGRMLITALLTAWTVPNPTSAALAALCSFAAMRLKIG